MAVAAVVGVGMFVAAGAHSRWATMKVLLLAGEIPSYQKGPDVTCHGTLAR